MQTFKEFCASFRKSNNDMSQMARIIANLDSLPDIQDLLTNKSRAVQDWLKREELDVDVCFSPTLWLVDQYLSKKYYHGLDTETEVYFYEHEFYVLSNFSAFRLLWRDLDFDTSEHAYQWSKFAYLTAGAALSIKLHDIKNQIISARSAHDARRVAHEYEEYVDPDWDEKKEDVMYEIIVAKETQHPYVHKKLMETGTRRLIENSWRDSFWGWGEDGKGLNKLGLLWEGRRQEHINSIIQNLNNAK